jgi:hypothetical protein
MKLKEAIKRLMFTISKQNKPNQSDAEALNSIINFVNLSNKEVIKDNELLAKMYCFVLKEFLVYYKDVTFASSKINKDILSMPIDYHLQLLLEQLRTNEITMYFDSLNLNPTWENGQNIDEIRKNIIENKKIFKETDINIFKEVIDTWDLDNVNANFEFNFNLALNTYKNV